MHVHTQRLIRRYAHVDTQVKFVTVNQQGISNILGDDACLLNIDIVNVIDDVNAFALTCIGWLDDPYILLAFMLL
jgi:hypothetical protein